MTARQLSILVEGGYALTRAATEALLAQLPGIHVMSPGCSSDPDVILWDSEPHDPPFSELRVRFSGIPIVVLSNTFTPQRALAYLRAGVQGCVPKSETSTTLSQAIRQVARGENYLPPHLAMEILACLNPPSQASLSAENRLSNLSPRELEVLSFLCQGLSNKAIAARMYLSIRTVEGHILHLCRKLGVRNRIEAALVGLHHGLGSGNQ